MQLHCQSLTIQRNDPLANRNQQESIRGDTAVSRRTHTHSLTIFIWERGDGYSWLAQIQSPEQFLFGGNLGPKVGGGGGGG